MKQRIVPEQLPQHVVPGATRGGSSRPSSTATPPSAHRDPVQQRQRVSRAARRPRRGSRCPRSGDVRQRVPRDVEHPPCRGGVRVRHDRPDDRQRPRRQDRLAVGRRRAVRPSDRRPRRTTTGCSTCAGARFNRELVWRTAAGKAVQGPVGAPGVARPSPHRGDHVRGDDAARIGARGVGITRGQPPGPEFDARGGEFTESVGTETPEHDPRRHRTFNHRVLQPRLHTADDRQITLGYQCTNSKMSLACAVRHQVVSPHNVRRRRRGQRERGRRRSSPASSRSASRCGSRSSSSYHVAGTRRD